MFYIRFIKSIKLVKPVKSRHAPIEQFSFRQAPLETVSNCQNKRSNCTVLRTHHIRHANMVALRTVWRR